MARRVPAPDARRKGKLVAPGSRLHSESGPLRPYVKLLVFATIPPPVHGQNLMVATLLDGLRAEPGFSVFHIDPQLSRTSAEVGRWQLRKLFNLLGACVRALRVRMKHGPMAFYYVPAPAKRGALYRDWLVMLLCRPAFGPLILHWHAVGLGEWLQAPSRALERGITQLLLGRAALSIVLDPALAGDAALLAPRRIAIVPNGIADPAPDWVPSGRPAGAPLRCLFLGLCSAEKGLFDLVDAMERANRSAPTPLATLTVAGAFAREEEQLRFAHHAAVRSGLARWIGPVHGEAKEAAFREADVFCFPTRYPHEGQPLVLLEALAHDLPVVATNWRAIPGMLPADGVQLVEPGDIAALAAALSTAAHARTPRGVRRAHFLRLYQSSAHLHALRECLRSVEQGGREAPSVR